MYIQKDNYDSFLKDPFNEDDKKTISYASDIFGFDVSKVLKLLISSLKYINSFFYIIVFITLLFLIFFNYYSFIFTGFLIGYVYLVYTQF